MHAPSATLPLLCIDIGNTRTHYGLVGDRGASEIRHLSTAELNHPTSGLAAVLAQLEATGYSWSGIAFCSVVPAAADRLRDCLAGRALFQLTSAAKLGVKISYPRPQEIGQDRLANAVAAQAFYGAPAVVIDMGTAVTFDIVTPDGGYEGGIIAPGMELMRRYLHEQTALLPELDDSLEVAGPIGQSTREAMRIGCVVGFGGMIQALLDLTLQEMIRRGLPPPTILATGGSAELLHRGLRQTFSVVPDLTLRGLSAAWQLNFSNSP
jgi:type III pantothenate kinase